MKKLILYLLALFVTTVGLNAQLFNTQETVTDTIPPVIDIVPGKIEIIDDTSRFAVRTVKILNRGGGALKIIKIDGSCSCSNGYILSNNIYSMSVGELRLEINKDGMEEDDDSVVFIITSNAKNSPTFLTVKFIKPPEIIPENKDEIPED